MYKNLETLSCYQKKAPHMVIKDLEIKDTNRKKCV